MENVKLKVLKQYSHDYLDGITFTPDKDVVKGSDGRYYKVLTSDGITFTPDKDVFKGSDGRYYKVLTSDEVDAETIQSSQVLDNEYGWVDDNGLHYFTICRV